MKLTINAGVRPDEIHFDLQAIVNIGEAMGKIEGIDKRNLHIILKEGSASKYVIEVERIGEDND